MPSNPSVNHAVVLAGILLFSLGVLLGALLPVRRALPRRPVGMNGYGANLGECQLLSLLLHTLRVQTRLDDGRGDEDAMQDTIKDIE